MVQCETVLIAVYQHGEKVSQFEVPAYTRTPENFIHRMGELQAEYMNISAHYGKGLSVADFGLWLLTRANFEPTSQEHEEEPPEVSEYDPGPEVDDEGGMSEYRNMLPDDPLM